MYHFAVVALLGLATLKVSEVLKGIFPGLDRMYGLLPFVVAVAATVGMDYSLFDGFGITLRDTWMGAWTTGFIAGSLAGVWHAVLGYLGSSEEGSTHGAHEHGRPRMAA